MKMFNHTSYGRELVKYPLVSIYSIITVSIYRVYWLTLSSEYELSTQVGLSTKFTLWVVQSNEIFTFANSDWIGDKNWTCQFLLTTSVVSSWLTISIQKFVISSLLSKSPVLSTHKKNEIFMCSFVFISSLYTFFC